ncbi:hypothetical protein BC628DRAFT_1326753 [Trametes gibbosa]|nr:hypothetical protein BC628DRAFT_1326753 [Trametes gibbosa]
MEVLNSLNYQLKLPTTWKIHPVFHACFLTPYKENNIHGPNYTRPTCYICANSNLLWLTPSTPYVLRSLLRTYNKNIMDLLRLCLQPGDRTIVLLCYLIYFQLQSFPVQLHTPLIVLYNNKVPSIY